MKSLLVIATLAALAGCATQPRDYRYAQPGDPSQWRVVSVTPVPAGTAERVARESGTGSSVQYSTQPIYTPAPGYSPAPIYSPAPVYTPEPAYYYPPVTLSLGFIFGRGWGHSRHHFGGRGHGRHR